MGEEVGVLSLPLPLSLSDFKSVDLNFEDDQEFSSALKGVLIFMERVGWIRIFA